MLTNVTNAISKLPQILLDQHRLLQGSRILIVASNNAKNRAPFNQTMLTLQKKGRFQCVPFLSPSGNEAKIETVDDGVLMAQKTGCEAVLAVGGGTIIDIGKMISAVLTNGGSVNDYIKSPKANVVNKELFDEDRNINPTVNIAIPTLMGSGAELSNHAVLLNPGEEKMITFSNDLLRPNFVVADKSFAKGVSNSLESVVCFANFARAIDLHINNVQSIDVAEEDVESWGQHVASLEASKLYLSTILKDDDDDDNNDDGWYEIASGASFQSAYSLNISDSGLSISARFAQTICGLFSVPYANVHSAIFLPLLKARIDHAKIKNKKKDIEFLDRLQVAASTICEDPSSNVDDLIQYLEDVYEKLGLQNMKELGMSRTDSELAISLVFTENDLEEIQLLGRETLLNVIVAEE